MADGWKLKRTVQCAKCPWRTDVDPRDIPNGYDEERHRGLASTIAGPVTVESLSAPLVSMACHETHEAHCIGWVHNQAGAGNNVMLRLRLRTCENIGKLRIVGEQHPDFASTLPKPAAVSRPRRLSPTDRRDQALLRDALVGAEAALDAYQLAKITRLTAMRAAQLLNALEAQGMVVSGDESGTANDLMRRFHPAEASR